MELYPWVVLGHVVLIILALGAHGVSAFAMFRARSETDRARLAAVWISPQRPSGPRGSVSSSRSCSASSPP